MLGVWRRVPPGVVRHWDEPHRLRRLVFLASGLVRLHLFVEASSVGLELLDGRSGALAVDRVALCGLVWRRIGTGGFDALVRLFLEALEVLSHTLVVILDRLHALEHFLFRGGQSIRRAAWGSRIHAIRV